RAGRPLQRQVAVQGGDDGGCVERGAVVELDPLAQRDRVGELVLRDRRQRRSQLRHDLRLGIQVVELLAEGQEDLAAGEGTGERRIERVGLAGRHSDYERASVLGRRSMGADCRRCGCGGKERNRSAREEGDPKASAGHRSASFRRRGLPGPWGAEPGPYVGSTFWSSGYESARLIGLMRTLEASSGSARGRAGLLRIDRELIAIGILGGLVMVPLLVLWARYGQREAHAASLGAIIPISIAGIATYGIAGEVRIGPAVALVAGSVVGARIGAGWLARIDERLLKVVFGVFLVGVAVLLFLHR